MTINEAVKCRHTVRTYLERKLPTEIAGQLDARIRENNDTYGLKMKLVLENTDAFSPIIRLTLAKGVRNYVILAGKDTGETDEKLGYCGADVMLFAQTLGLNSWWVGGTFSRKGAEKNAGITGADKLAGVIAVGYGATQGVPHRSKAPEEVSRYNGTTPEWFQKGVEAALLAPTALNKQDFVLKGEDGQVSISYKSGKCSDIDLGIVKYHFEVGAGRENFIWV